MPRVYGPVPSITDKTAALMSYIHEHQRAIEAGVMRASDIAKHCVVSRRWVAVTCSRLGVKRPTRSLEDRLNKYIQRGEPDECWPWVGSIDECGYGRAGLRGRSTPAARALWELLSGTPVPREVQVCHRCDSPSCCNPSHLFLGTAKENYRDAMQKGRMRWAQGESNGGAKLTEWDVQEIRRRYISGENQQCGGLQYIFRLHQPDSTTAALEAPCLSITGPWSRSPTTASTPRSPPVPPVRCTSVARVLWVR